MKTCDEGNYLEETNSYIIVIWRMSYRGVTSERIISYASLASGFYFLTNERAQQASFGWGFMVNDVADNIENWCDYYWAKMERSGEAFTISRIENEHVETE